jgi:hypothetical protein
MRHAVTPLFAVAVSPERLARILEIQPREVREAIRNDHLACYRKGMKRRILIRDAEQWIVNCWERVRVRSHLKKLKEASHAG